MITRGHTTIYLFGTVHLLPKGVAWFGGPLARAFTASNTLVTEILDPDPEEMRRLILADAMLPEGKNLRSLLPPADRRALMRALTANHLTADAFDHYQPWYAAVALSTLPLLQAHYDQDNGVDRRLSERAKALGLDHQALETPALQLGIFASLPLPLQKRYLHEVLNGLPDISKELAKMISAWKAGDATRLARLMNQHEDDPRLRELLLTARNRTWARWIRQRLQTPARKSKDGRDKPDTLFIAVGAGHLAGANSLIAQLAAYGIHARRIQ